MIQKLITKYENLSKALEGFETKELVDNFLADLHKLKSEDGKLPIPHVSGWLNIEDEKPEIGDRIRYKGNIDWVEAEYIGVGKVMRDDGLMDKFELWRPACR